MRLFGRDKSAMVEPDSALPGRAEEMRVPDRHEVLGTPLQGPFPDGVQTAIFGMGCFWGAERIFWEADGVYTTAVGYAGGITPNPTYEEVCSGRTGHAEVSARRLRRRQDQLPGDAEAVLGGTRPDPGHAPGQRRRHPVPLADPLVRRRAARRRGGVAWSAYQQMLSAAGHGTITTELAQATALHPFYYAEAYHQQYLAKNPGGYCGLGGTGVACPVGIAS